MITPTIGRVVLFNDGRSTQRVPALISYVVSDTIINIGGFDKSGNPFQATNVFLVPSDSDAVCSKGQAEWMEYQKSVADKYHDVPEEDLPQETLPVPGLEDLVPQTDPALVPGANVNTDPMSDPYDALRDLGNSESPRLDRE